MKLHRNIRLLVVFSGVILWLLLWIRPLSSGFYGNLDSSGEGRGFLPVLILGFIVVSLWNFLPYIIYLIATIRVKSLIILIIPGVAVLGTHLFYYIKLVTSEITDGQAGLIILFWPIGELIFLGAGFLVGYLMTLIIKRFKTTRT
jgi:hypothetical protein